MLEESRHYIATPPGATIKEQIVDRGMTQKEFAIRMGMSEKHISKLINGDVHLTPDVAERLELVLGIFLEQTGSYLSGETGKGQKRHRAGAGRKCCKEISL